MTTNRPSRPRHPSGAILKDNLIDTTRRTIAPQLAATVGRVTVCPRCDGSGIEPGAPADLALGEPLCGACNGTGEA